MGFHLMHLVSIAAWVVIAVLLIAELKSYMSPQLKEHLVVDTSLGQQLTVNFNVTFHALTCAEVIKGESCFLQIQCSMLVFSCIVSVSR